jgi:membrane protein DedA with SNARE-associated domain
MAEMLQWLQPWLDQYGCLAIFTMMMLAMLWAPLPEETFLTGLGILIHQGRLGPASTALAAFAGTTVGVTGMYFLGRTAGLAVIRRFGWLVRLTPQQLQRAHDWFDRRGKWTLTFGYYIPYVRHINAMVAGTTRIKYAEFAFFAYPGGAVWVATFLMLGYYLGDNLDWITQQFRPITAVLLVLASIAIVMHIYRRRRGKAKGPDDARRSTQNKKG